MKMKLKVKLKVTKRRLWAGLGQLWREQGKWKWGEWEKKTKRTKYNFKALCISQMLTGSRPGLAMELALRLHN